jgi:hypothetical protein
MRIGKYEIIKPLARGGMAEILLARARGLPGFQRMVVIKRILPLLACNTDFLQMFLNEARIAATLQHPNLVQLYDVGVVDGHYFIAMEYLHGENLNAILATLQRRKQRIPLEHALHIAIDVCAGLHYAHEKIGFDGQPLQIVHRDVSPHNVIVTFDGAIKLLDFGVAKAANSTHETNNGIVKGKVSYMSPEQCRSAALDRRSDLYSVGIVLYEMTLGRRLYGGGTELETLKRITEQPVPPPRVVDPNYDEELERIVMRALAKDPDRRYQSARELQLDLEELARKRGLYMSAIALQQFLAGVFGPRREAWRDASDDCSVELTVAPPRKRSWRLPIALGLAAACLLAALPFHHSSRHHAPVATVTRPPPVFVEAPLPSMETPPAPLELPPAPMEARPARREEGKLVLAARPWCEVTIDGAPRGPTPATVRLAAGVHRVRLTNAAFHIDHTIKVDIAPRRITRRALSFPVVTQVP